MSLYVILMLVFWYSWWCVLLVQEAVFSVAVEAVFPKCAIIRLGEWDAELNRQLLSELQDGSPYDVDGERRVCGGWLVAGSQAEGVAMEEGWGQPKADMDNMNLLGGPLRVQVPQSCQPPGHAVLRYRPEGCPPAYCKIEVTDAQAIIGVWVEGGGVLDAGCVRSCEGLNWLHTNNMFRLLQGRNDNINGPAGQMLDGFFEAISTLVCSNAHPDMERSYVHRPRHGWPSPQQLAVIKQLRMLLVLTGHKQSHPDEIPLQAMLFWSPSEMVLITELPENIKQVYIAIKYAFKCFMKTFLDLNKARDGRSYVGSYHLKTVLLHHLEKRPPTMIWSQLDLMFALLYDLDAYLKEGELPHYFLPECNLLATVGPEERYISRNVIKHILSDPLSAILMCPTDPKVIYGKVPPDALVATFSQVSSQPISGGTHENLLWLLSCLDETRHRLYQCQQEWDRRRYGRVSNRPELTGLVDMLLEQIHEW